MLDFRIETFLTLCEEKSFTKTARKLCISQPAVSQHIHFLEQYYDKKLITFKGKNLYLTPEGEQLYNYSLLSKADWIKAKESIKNAADKKRVQFGATLTIGEYVMPQILSVLLQEMEEPGFTMLVDNTETLLLKLKEGEIDFAFVEGQFHKSDYTTRLFSLSRFIPICSGAHPFAHSTVDFEEIFVQRLITREIGSGTRGVLEQVLIEHSHNITDFHNMIEIGNLNVIKHFVEQGLGISFLYENAVLKEITQGTLQKINLIGFNAEREFNFVCRKGSQFLSDDLLFFDNCQRIYQKLLLDNKIPKAP